MFDQLFRYPGVVRRHRDGPLADERATYLGSLATRGIAPETLLKYARFCLAVAHVVEVMPRGRSFTTCEIDRLAREWAVGRVQPTGRCPTLAPSAIPGDRHGVSPRVGALDTVTDVGSSLRA